MKAVAQQQGRLDPALEQHQQEHEQIINPPASDKQPRDSPPHRHHFITHQEPDFTLHTVLDFLGVMKLLMLLLCCLLLSNLVTLHTLLPQRSTQLTDASIDALWYRGRGIRPVGRFGRRGAGGRTAERCGRETPCSACCFTHVYMSSKT